MSALSDLFDLIEWAVGLVLDIFPLVFAVIQFFLLSVSTFLPSPCLSVIVLFVALSIVFRFLGRD